MTRWMTLGLLGLALHTAHGQTVLEFSGHRWTVRGDARIETHLGEQALIARNASVVLEDMRFANGTIEFDLATTGPRSFVGVAFHLQDEGVGYEHFYLRPHQTGRFDALQYTPNFNGVAAWQLHPEHNTAVEIPRDRWMHVRLVIRGHRLQVYLDRDSEAVMDIERLEGRWRDGQVAILSNFPAAAAEPDHYPTAYANFEIQPETFVESATSPEPEADPGVIDRWALSPAFTVTELPIETPPEVLSESAGWEVVQAEPSGRLNIARHRTIPEGSSVGTVATRVVVRADRPGVRKLNLGFSDRASVLLNGQVVFSGNNTYRSRSERYLGVMTIDNDALYLPLRQGDNELVILVSEAFGGWGVMARFADSGGLMIRAAAP